jgi:hypothetical protein
MILGLVAASLLAFGPTQFASGSSGHHHRASPHVEVLVKPAAVDAGGAVTVSGRIAHANKGGYRLDLQAKVGKKFATVVSARPTAKHRYSLGYRAPEASGSVRLRVRLRRAGRELSHTKSWLLSIRAPQAAAAPSPRSRTLVLDPATILSVPAPGEAGPLRVAGHADLQVGDVIAIGVGPNTPYGFLGKVTSVSFDGTSTVAETIPATLPEALPEGEFSQHLDGGEIDSETSSAIDAAPVSESHEGAHSTNALAPIPVKVSLHCEGGAQVQVSGSVALNPSIDIDAGWSPFGGVHARFVGKATASAELSASADAAASCQVGPQLLFKRVLSPIAFSVGPIPVVVVPIASAYLSADGNVEVSVDSEIHGSVTASAGIEYSHGDAHPVAGFEKDFGWTPPDPQGSAHLGAKVSPTLDLLIYGVGGPEAQFNVGLAVDANLFDDPAWTLTAPVSLTAKLAIPALHISSPQLTVYQHTFLLAQAGDDSVQGLIHFDEFSEGTTVADQYRDLGVVFDSPVFITSDSSNPTSPVLSGTPLFAGPIEGHFVKPGTDTPTTVNVLQLDAGYIDNPGSVEIVAHLADGRTRTAIADHLGIDQISISTRGISSFSAQAVSQEDAGFAVDNLGFGP